MLTAEQMQRVEILQQKISSFRAQVEKLEQYLENLQVDATNAKLRLNDLTSLCKETREYSEDLEMLQPDNPQLSAFLGFETRYLEVATVVPKIQNRDQTAFNSTLNTSSVLITERQELLRLPKIRIPVFDGKRENWASYKNKFLALVHSRSDISDAVKCSQLFDSLVGQALAKVGQFDPSEQDYSKVWQTLLDFYDHKRTVAVEHLNAILDPPKITKPSADELSTLLDTARLRLHILDGLGARSGDDFIVRIIERCLPPVTRSKWQDKLDMDELPKLDGLLNFIQSVMLKHQAFDSSNHSKQENHPSNQKKRTGETRVQPVKRLAKGDVHTFVTSRAPESAPSSNRVVCPLCRDRLFKCHRFIALSVKECGNIVRDLQACRNCLWKHPLPCKSTQNCRVCQQKHHTLLHADQSQRPPSGPSPSGSSAYDDGSSRAARSTGSSGYGAGAFGFLSYGELDHGEICSPLKFTYSSVDGLCTISTRYIRVGLNSRYNNFAQPLSCLLVPQIASSVPRDAFARDQFHIPKNLQLADPQFYLPKSIDLLVAANITLSVLSISQIKLVQDPSTLILQKTPLSWIAAGDSGNSKLNTIASCNVIKLDKLIERFWLIDDFDHEPLKSRDEVVCEQHFVTNTQRDSTGRYVVRLPFRDSKFQLGESRTQALKRFQSLTRKLAANPSLGLEYGRVMDEYIALGHMTQCDDAEGGCYLPHHAGIKESRETTKVRVVFDASGKTSTGISLNDAMFFGPTIQNNIFEQVIRFRTHRYVITADIKKMYRQILVHPEDRQFQKIFWHYQGKTRTFQLNTVTFDTTAAPFLALRTLQQLARDEAHAFPRTSKLLLRDFYVDDVITGADHLDELINIRDEMIALLARGGFYIRKWASNHNASLESIAKQTFDLDCLVRNDPVQKTLGIIWDARDDLLRYIIHPIDPNAVATKRKLLSELSKIFDPLGLLAPVTLYAKVLTQDRWKAKVTWDESLPQEIHTRWSELALQLPVLHEIAFPRQIRLPGSSSNQIHGFCDAAKYGYGACLYLRSRDSHGEINIRLVGSKSRVATTCEVTIPRLALCAASLLKKLYTATKTQFEFELDQTYLWSDSTIVLCWLTKAPHLLGPFETNRVADIQSLGDQVQWRHVRSEDNPADALSRGQLPSEFLQDSRWTSGPDWLTLYESHWPNAVLPANSPIPGLKTGICLVSQASPESIYSRFSDFNRLLRVISYILRWRNHRTSSRGPISVREIEEAEFRILLMVQRERFPVELRKLSVEETSTKANMSMVKGTPSDQLNPFIDARGLLRVGGRLRKSDLSFDHKHPILLSSKHPVTDLIITRIHQENLHIGIQSTLHVSRSKFWILNGKNQVRKIIHHCIECIRQKSWLGHAKMADLPSNRSFLKAYGSVFLCMVSKAVHIELTTDLSSEAFLTVFRRFISRRGVPEHVYSVPSVQRYNALPRLSVRTQTFVTKRIEWHFNPPLSPHIGGIWGAAVKSFKHHLRRVVKDQKLTYEQLNILLIEIEAILNSRPLYALSADPNDPLAITPAHLLISRSFNAFLERSFLPVPDNRLSVYNFITKAKQDFLSKWYKECLHEMQVRQKWHESTAHLGVGSVVLLIEDAVACSRWPLGVILEVFPGSSGIARVASMRTANGVYKRNIT
ncbi:uncharacterized protein LOC135172605 [Diachasmimorpha longicaudata]|uniref:uncharacterized protein LOC135172605 n=1 Tax=Diachasmimorpha longicaudata TaxID=58733 RepID=UPI0030B89AF0